MPVGLELRLDERCVDRVRVTLLITPSDEGSALDGAALQLVSSSGEERCPRLLLPFAGRLSGPLCTTVELRATGALGEGCRVIARAWSAGGEVELVVPADPAISLRDHLRGSRLGMPEADDILLEVPSEAALAALVGHLPWLTEAASEPEVAGVLEAPPEEPTAENLKAAFGLDDDCAKWLEGLLDEV